MDSTKAQKIISALGLAALCAAFCLWWSNTSYSLSGRIAATASILMFAVVCLRFVPGFVSFLREKQPEAIRSDGDDGVCVKIFFAILLWDLLLIFAVFFIRRIRGSGDSLLGSLDYWLYLDSHHYLDIARDWYLSEGELDRLVQLVFLPGYPVAVRLMHLLVPDYTIAGFLVSMLCFGGSGCMLYKLVRLDCDRKTALYAVLFFCIIPGSFFFAAPMSESLFILMSLCCLYYTRRGKTLIACLFGMYAAFTRSLGILLIVPVMLELISGRRKAREYLACLLIPMGFAAYLFINYLVAGDPFRFMLYQKEHWGQSLGWFFGTAAYQLKNFSAGLAGNKTVAFGLWLPNLTAQLLSLLIMIPASKKLRPSYTAHFIVYYAVAIGATWLLSAPRYLAAQYCLPVAAAYLNKDRGGLFTASALMLCAFIGFAYLICFCGGWQVW